MNNIEVFTHVESQGLTPVSFNEFLKNSFNDDGNIHKRNNNIEPIFYLHFEEPFNGEVKMDLLFNCDVYSTIPSNYYIEVFFNDDTSDSKTFKKQKDLIQYIKEIINGNI